MADAEMLGMIAKAKEAPFDLEANRTLAHTDPGMASVQQTVAVETLIHDAARAIDRKISRAALLRELTKLADGVGRVYAYGNPHMMWVERKMGQQ